MKKLRILFIAVPVFLTVLFWLADPAAVFDAKGFFAWRGLLVQLSGLLAFGCMTVAMLLATRPVWLESHLDGLDKMYRVHKWLGVSAVLFGLAHFLLAKAPKWLSGTGLLAGAVRMPPPDATSPVHLFFRSLRGTAEAVGEAVFFIAVAIVLVALIGAISYTVFYKLHRLLSLAYLALAFHALILFRFRYWATPLGVVVAVMLGTGILCALVALFRRIGTRRKSVGIVESATFNRATGINDISVRVGGSWRGHEAGQFVFLTFDPREGAHPFTVSSGWKNDGNLSFCIKTLGDYTRNLSTTVKQGGAVIVEGPYGRFTFAKGASRQIWVSGGIGVTPFLARLHVLAADRGKASVDYFHTTASTDERALRSLAAAAALAGVRVRSRMVARDGLLPGDRIREEVPDWKNADIWFCGPQKFGDALRTDFVGRGYPERRFHQEAFIMR